MKFRTILVDPPWPQINSGRRNRPKGDHGEDELPYPTMELSDILALPVAMLAEPESHLWLWTTNQFLSEGLQLMKAWGFKYLAPIHMLKPTGMGNYFIHRTQTLLMGYREKCVFSGARYLPNVVEVKSVPRHSEKPEDFYQMIESVSEPARLELFARKKRDGWSVWGNEVPCDVSISL